MIAIASSPLPVLPITQVMGDTHYLPRSALSKVPSTRARPVARGSPGRSAAAPLFPCRFHRAGARGRHRAAEQGGGLRHPAQDGSRDDPSHQRRPEASWCRDRDDRHSPYLGPDPDASSACPLPRAGRRYRTRWTLGSLSSWLLPSRSRPVTIVSSAIPGAPAGGVR